MTQSNISSSTPATLTIDIGGQGIKGLVYEGTKVARGERLRVKTPRPARPDAVLAALVAMVETMRPHDRMTVGFPGVVVGGVVRTAPNLDGDWSGVRLQEKLAAICRIPTRVINDADLQGYGAINNKGLEMVLTLGTGMGAALYIDGRLVPNLELGHHPFEKESTYEERLGQSALDKAGKSAWEKRLWRAVDLLRKIFNFDTLYIGGGNARLITAEIPSDVVVVKNAIVFQGGARLWELPGAEAHATWPPLVPSS